MYRTHLQSLDRADRPLLLAANLTVQGCPARYQGCSDCTQQGPAEPAGPSRPVTRCPWPWPAPTPAPTICAPPPRSTVCFFATKYPRPAPNAFTIPSLDLFCFSLPHPLSSPQLNTTLRPSPPLASRSITLFICCRLPSSLSAVLSFSSVQTHARSARLRLKLAYFSH